jgi:hypothetical protein
MAARLLWESRRKRFVRNLEVKGEVNIKMEIRKNGMRWY